MNRLLILFCLWFISQALVAAELQFVNGQLQMKNIIINHDKWRITNDGVMGGLSNGVVSINAGNVMFSGVISTENNGGFSSTYMPIEQQPKGLKAVEIKVTGDGNLYQLRFRRQYRGYAISYKLLFKSIRGETTSHQFNLADAQATFRGRPLPNAPTLTSESITNIGLLIASKEALPFKLTLHQINISE